MEEDKKIKEQTSLLEKRIIENFVDKFCKDLKEYSIGLRTLIDKYFISGIKEEDKQKLLNLIHLIIPYQYYPNKKLESYDNSFLSQPDREKLLKLLELIINDNKRLKVVKIKNSDFYQVRSGNFRIIFHLEGKEIIIDSIKMRNENHL